MEVLCVICQETVHVFNHDSGESAQRISAMVCGHVFHMFCIDKWLEQSVLKSCPKCRFLVKAREKAAFQLFLELASRGDDADSDSFETKALKKELEVFKNNLNRIKERCAYLKNELDSAKIEISTLKTKHETIERLFSVTKSRHRVDLQELNQCRDEMNKLQKQVESFRMTNTFVNGSVTDAEEVVTSDLLDKSQLGLLCVTYKKDGQKLMRKLEAASEAIDKGERERHLLSSELKKVKSELEELKKVYNLASGPAVVQENLNTSTPPVVFVSGMANKEPKRRMAAGFPIRSRLSGSPRNPFGEKYDGLGGHTSSSLIRPKFKVVTSRTIMKK